MTTIKLEGKEYQIDIEQAKKLNLLKEKDNRVKSWEEFIEKYRDCAGYGYDKTKRGVIEISFPFFTEDQLRLHEAKAINAFSKLLKLRRDWIGEWEPDWSDVHHSKGVIWNKNNELAANTSYTISKSLSFPTYKMAQEFLETFHDLIEDAKILI